MTQHFCTYFDSNFLFKGLTLYRSLTQHMTEPFALSVLCLDEVTYQTLIQLALPSLQPISIRDFEAGDTELLKAKQNRSRVEYFFTCTPSLPLFVFNRYPETELVTYLDADLFFFTSPRPVFEEFGRGSVLIIGHRYAESDRYLEQYGIYNVGLLSFRNDDAARECLEWWRSRCLEWCYDRVEDGRFADQKYLDDWPQRFRNVVELRHKGTNVAPWNVFQYRITKEKGRVRIDGDDLVCYHFHRLKRFNQWLCDPGLSQFRSGAASPEVRDLIYRPYLRALNDTHQWLRIPQNIEGTKSRYRRRGVWADAARSFLRRQLIFS